MMTGDKTQTDEHLYKEMIKLTPDALRRKRDQHSEMMSMAAADGDKNDAARHLRIFNMAKKVLREYE